MALYSPWRESVDTAAQRCLLKIFGSALFFIIYNLNNNQMEGRGEDTTVSSAPESTR